MNLEQARANMIEQQIRPWEVLDPVVISVLGSLRREDFVPNAHRALAFADLQIPLLDAGSSPSQGTCMLEPKVEAKLLQEVRLQPTDRVLEVGTGSGFMAALLSRMAAQVVSLEILPALCDIACNNLQRAGVTTVQVVQGDGSQGRIDGAPWDAIMLSGSVELVPQALLSQLVVGGRLTAIEGQWPVMQACVHTRVSENAYRREVIFETVAPRLLHFPQAARFKF